MPYSLEQLIERRGTPVHILRRETIRYALKVMREYDFSQLPVVDEQGNLSGIISEQNIVRALYTWDEYKGFLDLEVDHVARPIRTLSPDNDLSDALERLRTDYAVIIARDNKPVGIITHADTTTFFQQLSEGMMLVEEIERSLRRYIEALFPDLEERERVVRAAHRPNGQGERPINTVEDLTLGEEIELIRSQKNWDRFEPYLRPQALFSRLLGRANAIRNQLMHFRGENEADQRDTMAEVVAWLDSRPKVPEMTATPGATEAALPDDTEDAPTDDATGKYAPLGMWLQKQARADRDLVTISFAEIERLLDDALPPSARKYRNWWANDVAMRPQARAWTFEGWNTTEVDIARETVAFVRAQTRAAQTFYFGVLEALRKIRPEVAHNAKVPPRWIAVPSPLTGCYYFATFNRTGLRVEFYIDPRGRDENKRIFDALFAHRAEIEAIVGAPLTWDRMDDKKASRIYAMIPLKITDPPAKLAQSQEWAAEMLAHFVDGFAAPLEEVLR